MFRNVYPDIFVVHFLSLLSKQRGLRVLDAGCGAGRNSIFLASEGLRVTAIDQSPQMLARGVAAAHEAGVEVIFLRGRLEALPLADGAFDLLVCSNVVETMSIAAVQQAAREVWRVLRPEGRLLLVTAAQEGSDLDYNSEETPSPQTPFKARLSTKEELQRWFPGFRLEELLHLRLEFPASSPVRAQWALVARRLATCPPDPPTGRAGMHA